MSEKPSQILRRVFKLLNQEIAANQRDQWFQCDAGGFYLNEVASTTAPRERSDGGGIAAAMVWCRADCLGTLHCMNLTDSEYSMLTEALTTARTSVPPLTTEQAGADSTANQTKTAAEFAAGYTSIPEDNDDPDEPLSEQRPWPPHRIGVYDYASCVSELRNWYTQLFPGRPLTDPQDMIQLFAAEIQNLRRKNATALSNLQWFRQKQEAPDEK